MKRVVSVFNKKNKNGDSGGKSNGTSNEGPSSRGKSPISKKPSKQDIEIQPDHSIIQTNISEKLTEFGQLVHRVTQPLPDQTGDGTYIEETTPTGLFDDLKTMRIKDFETLEMKLKDELSGNVLTNDKTMIMERTIQLVSKLPSASRNRVKLTNQFIGLLWDSLEHPPQSYLGEKYKYRQADGSYNNIHLPDLGQAGQPYARAVIPNTMLPPAQPDPGVIFDSIMDREKNGFKPHPNNISSMLYYIATIIIHDCFRTSHDDFNISTTSSYLDLSPLYGSSQEDQNNMRTFQNGLLKPDCFSEPRLLGFPPGVGCILIMFNRFHNYCAQQLAMINEGGRFSTPKDHLEGDRKDAAWKKYDNDLFQTARLITNGLYINVILLDYLRTIVNLNRTNSTWTLDPRAPMDKNTGTPSGTGNSVSCEFNLIYRWHSNISDRDDKWTQALYMKLFGKKSEDVSMHELLVGLGKFEASLPADPTQRDFDGLKRNADGTLSDDDLVQILSDSIEDVAGASGALNVPRVLKAVEILGMQQARAWNCASLNEFRKFFGLTPHETFESINSDPVVANHLKHFYDHPDFVELYSGLVCEDAKTPMVPGVGISPTYTISRAILSDAVTLVRGDRYLTSNYHPRNLTNWGYQESMYNLSINQGCVFYRLFLRAFPNHFKPDSIYAHYPLTIPDENHKIMTTLGRVGDYSYDRPARIPARIDVTSWEAAQAILNDGETFNVTWGAGLSFLMGKPGADFMLSGDGKFFEERRKQMRICLYKNNWEKDIKAFYEQETLKLLKEYSYKTGSGDVHQVDLIRDIGNICHTRFASQVFHLPIKDHEHPHGPITEHDMYTIVALIFVVIFFDLDPATSFPLRKAGLQVTGQLGSLVESIISGISKTSLVSGIVDPILNDSKGPLKDYGVHMIRQLLKTGLSVHETAWSQVLPTAVAMVANQAQVFAQCMDYYLSEEGKVHLPDIRKWAMENTAEADEKLLHYVMEGIRMNGTFGSYRRATKDITITDNGRQIHFLANSSAFVSFVKIAQDPAHYPDPHLVLLDRPISSYIFYGIGPHNCLGTAASQVALTAMLKTVGKLPGLRRAPGPQGILKKIPREVEIGPFYVYMDELWSMYWPFPSTMKVCWDGDVV